MKGMYDTLRGGGRKANATLLTMLIITMVFLLQYPQTIILIWFDYREICLDMTYVNMFPRMGTGEYIAGMVTLIGLFAGANAYTYKGGVSSDKPTTVNQEKEIVDDSDR